MPLMRIFPEGVVGPCQPVLDEKSTGDFLEREAFPEQVGEVQPEAALQRGDVEQTEKARYPGLGFLETALPRLDAQFAPQRFLFPGIRRPPPGDGGAHRSRALGHGAG